MNLEQFLDMGGYGVYVWPAYAVTLLVVILNVVLARASHRRALDEALRRAARQESKS